MRFVIVGGGTAGWATAHMVMNATAPSSTVTLISSPEIPTIGVGESTTALFKKFINKNLNTGLSEFEFLKETSATYKLGIKNTNWNGQGESYYAPLGDNFENETHYPHRDYDFLRAYHLANDLPYDITLQSQMMANNKLHFAHGEDIYKDYDQELIAYHLDAYKTASYLKKKARLLTDRFIYIEDTIKPLDFERDENGNITWVKTKGGIKVQGDLFFDCSGTRQILIDAERYHSSMGGWKSYEDELLVNRAMPFITDHKGPIPSYTHARAMDAGWMWQIPTQERLGNGYVYSDVHTTPEKAQEEVEKLLGHKIEPVQDIKFHTGRLSKFWDKNVIATGLSSAFMEPLEATSIHGTIMQVTHFLEHYYSPHMRAGEALSNQYNTEMTGMWDSFRDFLVNRYITPRTEPFWVDAREESRRSDRLKNQLEIWKLRSPRSIDYSLDKHGAFYNLSNILWYQQFIGMKQIDKDMVRQELIDYNLYEYAEEKYKQIKETMSEVLPNLIDTDEFYDKIRT